MSPLSANDFLSFKRNRCARQRIATFLRRRHIMTPSHLQHTRALCVSLRSYRLGLYKVRRASSATIVIYYVLYLVIMVLDVMMMGLKSIICITYWAGEGKRLFQVYPQSHRLINKIYIHQHENEQIHQHVQKNI